MLTSRSKTDKGKIYFFESLGFINENHIEKGTFNGIPGKLESTLLVPSIRNPHLNVVQDIKRILDDCAHPGLNAAYESGNDSLANFLKASGVFDDYIHIHTIRASYKTY